MVAVRQHPNTHHLVTDGVAGNIHRLESLRIAVLIVRLITAVIVLHVIEILLWASFYRWFCFPSWELAFCYSASS